MNDLMGMYYFYFQNTSNVETVNSAQILPETGGMNDPSSAISTAISENNSGLASNNQVQDSSSSIPFQSELQTSGINDTSPLGKLAISNG